MGGLNANLAGGTAAAPTYAGLGGTGGVVARAAIGNAVTQGVSIAVGLQDSFNWRGVVASAAAAGVGAVVENRLVANGADRASFGVDLATNAASSATRQFIQNERVNLTEVGTDAFGNALGQSVARNIKPAAVENPYSIGRKALTGAEKLAQGGSSTSFAGYSADFLRSEAAKEADAPMDAYMDSRMDPYLWSAGLDSAASGRLGKPMDLVKRAKEIAGRPKGAFIDPNDLKSVYAQLRGAQADPNTTKEERSYVTSAIRFIQTRGVTEDILGVRITEQMARDGAAAPSPGGMRAPGVQARTTLPRTQSEHVQYASIKAISGETDSTRIGKAYHSGRGEDRLGDDTFDLVNQRIVDAAGLPIMVDRRVDLKTGMPLPGSGQQITRPDAVSFSRGLIVDDKPLGRPIAKDQQEIMRFLRAYEMRQGVPARTIGIERYNPKTGEPVVNERYKPSDFPIRKKP